MQEQPPLVNHSPPSPDRSVIAANVVVMAKPAVPGQVKTRLIGRLCPQGAARVHAALLECVLERAARYIALKNPVIPMRTDFCEESAKAETLPTKTYRPFAADQKYATRINYFLAIDYALLPPSADSNALGVAVPTRWRPIDQGTGGLGQRLARVWQMVGDKPVIFLGADSPDVPIEALDSILPTLQRADIAVGPAHDGGYWTLAARVFDPRLLTGIDWGTSSVYHQTLVAARRAGLDAGVLASWHDIDVPADLTALRQRIDRTLDPALARLRWQLDRVLQDNSP